MIRRSVLLILLVLFAAVLPAQGEEMDMIVLLDVSESMFPYFDDTVNFLLRDIVDEHLEYGDGFHLLSFASSPEREIYRIIKNPADMEAVLARIMLLHPLGKYTDLLFALDYLYDYVSELPLSTAKNILILTDGIHDPPPGSAYPAGTAEERELNRRTAVEISTRLKREGWRVRLIEFPRGEESLDENGEALNDLYSPMAETLGVDVIPYENDSEISHTATGAPSLEFPDHLGRVGRDFTAPFTIRNYLDEAVVVKLEGVLTRGENILTQPVQLKVPRNSSAELDARLSVPELEPGEYLMEVELVFSDGLRIYPRSGELAFELRESSLAWVQWPLVILVIAVAGFLLIRYTIIPLRRHIESSADERTYIGLAPKDEEDDTSKYPAAASAGGGTVSAAGTGRRSGQKVPLIREGASSASGSSNAPGTTPAGGQTRPAKVPLTDARGSASSGAEAARSGPARTGKVPLLESGTRHTGGGKIPLSQISTHRVPGTRGGAVRELGHRPIEFRLAGQNPYNGGRNIRWIGSGTRSVGGGGSFFLIFLVKVPERIAEVTFEDNGLKFTPLKSEFFPDLHGAVADCIDRPIRLHTEQGDYTIIFREWVSPLERINTVLHLADEAGTKNYPPSES